VKDAMVKSFGHLAQATTLRADCGLSLQVRTNHAATMEADILATLKLGFYLHRRMTAKSPSLPISPVQPISDYVADLARSGAEREYCRKVLCI